MHLQMQKNRDYEADSVLSRMGSQAIKSRIYTSDFYGKDAQ